jgi:hypothetical protein
MGLAANANPNPNPNPNPNLTMVQSKLGLNWQALQTCAATGAPMGDALQQASAATCRTDNVRQHPPPPFNC